VITVDDALNAYTVFETLNARGLELSATDLLKNHLFSKVRVPKSAIPAATLAAIDSNGFTGQPRSSLSITNALFGSLRFAVLRLTINLLAPP
jgi:hypothetical protein